MNYRFEISSSDSSDFRCEIAIGGEQTFQQFHDKIVEILNYDRSQMASFFTLDHIGNRVKEIALMDMSMDEIKENMLVMDSTKINDVIRPGCLELEYVYDFFNNKYFKVEYVGKYEGSPSVVLPVCLRCEGVIPGQSFYGDIEADWGQDESGDYDYYDDSFMEEFDNEGYNDDGHDDGRRGGYYDEYSDGIRYENLDDYIDKL